VDQPAAPADGRRVTFAEHPVDGGLSSDYDRIDDGGGWNDDVERAHGQQADFERYHAAALSLPFGGAGGDDGQVFDRGFMALQPLSTRPPSRVASVTSANAATATSPSTGDPPTLHAMHVKFPAFRKGTMVFLGDTGAVIHGVSSGEHVYNRRKPTPEEQFLATANGHCMEVLYYGDLNLRVHSDAGGEDRTITLENIAVAPGLKYNLISFSQLQR
ncbi:unnamed protein product, partial [Scytosiphon promiscuus]